MDPKQREQLLHWARQTVYFAFNERTKSGPKELEEQITIRTKNVADRLLAEAESESDQSRPGDILISLAAKVFDWVADYRDQSK